MRKGFKIYSMLMLATLAGGMLQGCKKDVFDAEKVKATYKDKFPVADIDPSMDWKMTQPINVHIDVNEDAGEIYTVSIYDANPLLAGSTAHLLARGEAMSGSPFVTTLDCPTAYEALYVCRTDRHSRNVVKYASVQGGTLQASFGTSAETRALSSAHTTRAFSPRLSEEEVMALLPGAKEVRPSTTYKNGEVYKISRGDKPYQGKISTDNLSTDNPAIIIIEGTWAPNGNNLTVERGFEFYVLDGGAIKIPDTQVLTFKQSSNFCVFPGGTVTGNKILLTNASEGNANYNAGTIDIEELQIDQITTFYNYNEATIGKVNLTSGATIENHGTLTVGETNGMSPLNNYCRLIARSWTGGPLLMGSSSSAEIENLGVPNGNWAMKIEMESSSIITVTGKAHLDGAEVKGPNGSPALFKIEKIETVSNFKTDGSVCYEVNETGNFNNWEARFLEALKDSDGVLAKWGEAPVWIPEGDCTGRGNTPSDGSDIPDDLITYTYVFEDNFPLVGDYDFNDVVLDVSTEYQRESKTNAIKRIQYNITLAAAGASKFPLGIGLRLVGVDKSAVEQVKPAGDDSRFHATLQSSPLFNFNASSCTENDQSLLIPISGNVHKVFENGVEGELINTGDGPTRKAYTYEVILELADQTKTDPIITKDNLDFFLCYKYKNMQKRMEVHLYEFRTAGATDAGTVQKENLDVAGNNTWAICVPNFRYPREHINICNESDLSDCAYPEFLDWARNRDTNQDWYLHPNTANVYR